MRKCISNAYFKALVFDCDGVLFDSKEANRAYYNALLAAVGLPPMTEEQLAFAHCHTVFEVIDYLIPDPKLRQQAYKAREKLNYSNFLSYMRPEPYVKEALSAFKRVFKLGMATSRTNTIYRLLEIYDLRSFFDLIISALDVQRPKPHPEALYKIMDAFKIKNDELIYVGDAEVDAEMAKRASVTFVAYKRPDLPADIYVNNFLELAEVLGISLKEE